MANVAATATAAEVLEIDGPIIWISRDLDDSDQVRGWSINGKKMPMDLQVLVVSAHKREFYFQGELHRVGGPALIEEGEAPRYFVHGCEITDKALYDFITEG